MRRKDVIWMAVVVALGVCYARYFTHWGVKRPLLIRATQRSRPGDRSPIPPMYFLLDEGFRLTSVEVVPMPGEKFDPHQPPAWHLVSSSNSVPVRMFRYGQHIRGMHPAVTNMATAPLVPGTAYRLLVSAEGSTGSVDFRVKGAQ